MKRKLKYNSGVVPPVVSSTLMKTDQWARGMWGKLKPNGRARNLTQDTGSLNNRSLRLCNERLKEIFVVLGKNRDRITYSFARYLLSFFFLVLLMLILQVALMRQRHPIVRIRKTLPSSHVVDVVIAIMVWIGVPHQPRMATIGFVWKNGALWGLWLWRRILIVRVPSRCRQLLT
ncbi:hypothetical protein B0T22DRAFT_288464 [Podospora appendiculata]|uniref:Uncharacterized protein n=1 Tax=Podospora appendiculata TaxID=314037 RepID=A0AAE0X178_9PEZI|nr:hypothetical protein B0T22DRAFT_288464 [Podospora appendiculata]